MNLNLDLILSIQIYIFIYLFVYEYDNYLSPPIPYVLSFFQKFSLFVSFEGYVMSLPLMITFFCLCTSDFLFSL